jgi:Rps23 Pro-64 3,4-dihydroxylase Tpa1-like proline 4-hydroxylase
MPPVSLLTPTAEQTRFDRRSPVPHCVFREFFKSEFADRLHDEFPPLDALTKRYSQSGVLQDVGVFLRGDNIRGFGGALQELFAFLRSESFARYVESLSGIRIDPALTVVNLSSYVPFSHLDPHVDHRRAANGLVRPFTQVIYMSKSWVPEYGGKLILSTRPDLSQPLVELDPLFNTAIAWERTVDAWHGVTTVTTEVVARRIIAITPQTRDRLTPLYRARESSVGKALERSRLVQLGRRLVRRLI